MSFLNCCFVHLLHNNSISHIVISQTKIYKSLLTVCDCILLYIIISVSVALFFNINLRPNSRHRPTKLPSKVSAKAGKTVVQQGPDLREGTTNEHFFPAPSFFS